jgi:hypothetical protein
MFARGTVFFDDNASRIYAALRDGGRKLSSMGDLKVTPAWQ